MNKPLCCLIALLSFYTCYAQDSKHIETDRPNETEVPYIVPRKFMQVETGVRVEKKEAEGARVFSHPSLLVKYGLSDNLELRVKTSYSTQTEHYIPDDKVSSGLQPVEVGVKIAVLKEKRWMPKTALLLQTGIPGFSSGVFKADHLAPTVRLLMENNISENFSINYNAGAEWDGYETSPQWMYTVVPGIDIGEHVHLFAEMYSFLQKKETPEITLDGGLEYSIGKNIGLDICSGFGVNKAAPPFFLTIGGSIRFR